MTPDCDLCGDTGWITAVTIDDNAYEIPCPEGCAAQYDMDVFTEEAPF